MERESRIEEKQSPYIMGELLFTIYSNEADLFTIARMKVHDTNTDYDDNEIVIQGYFGNLQQSILYTFYGDLFDHKTFGLQFKVQSYETYMPKTTDGVVQFLSSDIFPGVGKKTAEAIVDKFGENALDELLENPDALLTIPHIRQKQADTIVRVLQEQRGFEQVAIALTSYGLSLKMAQRLYKYYKDETMNYIRKNPYDFVLEIEGFGFPTADKIASFNQIDRLAPERIQACCIYVLQNAVLDGHVYVPRAYCYDEMRKVLRQLDLQETVLAENLTVMDENRKIIIENERVYLPTLFYAEESFCKHIERILSDPLDTEITEAELMKFIGKTEEEDAIDYGIEQFEAIQAALHSKVMILTGGPGTGKTTVIRAIIRAYADLHELSTDPRDYAKKSQFPFILTAPTGRAAKRLGQSTGMKASTIHSLLGWDGHEIFEKNEHEKLSGKLIVIDEFSMVDTWLANHLFKAIPDDMQVLIVGDEDQLPSVGPGQVLADLIKTNLVPVKQLTEIYRQKDGSKIIELAHLIKQNTCTPAAVKNAKDFSFLPCNEWQVVDAVTTVFERAMNKGIDPKDVQILAPMYRTEAGINQINRSIQQFINPKTERKREVFFQDIVFRVGDRVIQLVNQPEDKVFNGDIGEIIQIFRPSENEEKEEQIVVKFDDADVVYTRADYFNIMHAYCISIHKSQGSEFPIVILPVVRPYRRMLRKNLLYTAITRSKQSLIICGDMEAFMNGIQMTDTEQRYTTLALKMESHLVDDTVQTETTTIETERGNIVEAEQVLQPVAAQVNTYDNDEDHYQLDEEKVIQQMLAKKAEATSKRKPIRLKDIMDEINE